ncbi:MAG: hypothetical protein KDC73_01995 [Ignavibacteriae bacterium]|nr:hypothetical protein [Ignavibacteriota bacterium]MCB9243293.1 hypothetical protein [Ignavibacteriales bacterium]
MIFRRVLFGLLIVFSANQILFAQSTDNFVPKLSHKLRTGLDRSSFFSPAQYDGVPDTFKIVAILAQFQEDNSGLTTGDGHFDLSNKYYDPSTQKDTVIDAPPYDSAYFIDHLKFLQNYFYKVSNGQCIVQYELYGKVITLPKKMEEYSPRANENLYRLGDLFTDAWTIADSFVNFSGYNENNTAFVIFHAGVGRDVDISSILGFDPTPYDLPTVYLGLNNLQEFYGSNYTGIQTNDGFKIQNSMIIPSTELRELNLISGNFLLELGLNGIFSASFGSYLGLPDLFNTSTGRTAIGRFGLMDGQSIFSFNGIFPPEPCAWSKIYLGWQEPITISSGAFNSLRVKNSSSGFYSDSTIYKVLISSKEYFLVENRNRDESGTGQVVHMRNRAFNDSMTFLQDTDNFNYFDITAVSGNIVDVKTPDWSLPGLINDTASLKGGILIWHIDENVIDANLSSNSVNTNIDHRGVALMEAKGAQTIGVVFSSPFGEIVGDGTYYDYWYNGDHGVPSTIYLNEFTPTTFPNTLSYSLANNNIFFTNFTSTAGIMSFGLSIGNSNISPVANFPRMLGIDSTVNSQPVPIDITANGVDRVFINNNNRVFGFNADGTGYNSTPDGLIIPNYGKFIPLSFDNQIFVVNDSQVAFFDANMIQTQTFNTGRVATCPPVHINSTGPEAVVGFRNGTVSKYTPAGGVQNLTPSTNPIVEFSSPNMNDFILIDTTYKYLTTGNILSTTSVDTLIIDRSNKILLNGKVITQSYGITTINNSPVLADLNKDGKQEIILVSNGSVYALNSQGVLLDNFPVNFNKTITSGVSVGDINSDGVFDLVFASSDGNLYAYSTNGNIVTGFPVLVGPNSLSTPALANLNGVVGIYIFSGDGYLYGFKTQYSYSANNMLWKNYLHDQYLGNKNFISINNPPVYAGKLPKDKVYNWPNPVYDNTTYIRYYINGAAGTVSIKILDLSGEQVTSLNATSFSNAENEVIWDVTNVQSGVYYGVIEAEVDGSKETQIIKIAVVK